MTSVPDMIGKRQIAAVLIALALCPLGLADGLTLAVFDSEASPTPGVPLAYDRMEAAGELTLRCRGVVIQGSGRPIVLCAVDWIGIANEGHDAFCDALAEAAGTTRDRVAVHALHQHDAPICDFTAAKLLREHGRDEGAFAEMICLPSIRRAAAALHAALGSARPVTHYGYGEAVVAGVASNRRIHGPDGKVRAVRFTTTADPALRAEPEGVIDPVVSAVSFWNGGEPLAVMTYYATHPQSYYRTGIANPDFPGIARFLRDQAVPGVLHVHFNGAGGNIGAGKFNDGSKQNRARLATRLAAGMEEAWRKTARTPLTAADVIWTTEQVALPAAKHLDAARLREGLSDARSDGILGTAMQLAWVNRCQEGHRLTLACLRIGKTAILHMPGELFVEYQLAAKAMRPDLHVAMAAYGDYGPGYVGTAAAYAEGGYETEPRSSFTDPEVEEVLTGAMRRLLADP